MVRLLVAAVITNLEGREHVHSSAAKTRETLAHFPTKAEPKCVFPDHTHIPLLPADGQVQVKEGQHRQALVLSTVLGEACHLLQLSHLLFGQHCEVTLLCHTGKRAYMDG